MATAYFPKITAVTVTPQPVASGASMKITVAASDVLITTTPVWQLAGYLTAYSGQSVPVYTK